MAIKTNISRFSLFGEIHCYFIYAMRYAVIGRDCPILEGN